MHGAPKAAFFTIKAVNRHVVDRQKALFARRRVGAREKNVMGDSFVAQRCQILAPPADIGLTLPEPLPLRPAA
jgi:hypothetical protein